jgi:preprotein translocase subunit SecY
VSPELGRRIAFTLGALLVFRIGTYIPLPGIDLNVWMQIFHSSRGSALDIVNAASGGAVARLAIFALGITPYVSAAIILQLASFFVRGLRTLRDSDHGRQKFEAYTRALTLLLALFQGFGIARALEGIHGLVAEPGPLFQFTIALTLAGGAMFLTWLAGQITLRGFGNGVALFLCAGIVMELPQAIYGAFELHRQGVVSANQVLGMAILAVLLVAVAALVEGARRKVPVTFGGREGRADAYLSFKLNGAGIIPALLATWLLTIPLVLWTYFDPDGSEQVRRLLQQGQTLHMICTAVLIFFCVYIYTALVLDPTGAADKLNRYGGTIPQIEPGEPTAEHLDSVLSRITLMGAVYFVVICLIPELLLYRAELPFYLGGTSLLILVCTVLDMEKQARSFASMTT